MTNINSNDIRAAAERIRGTVERTPLVKFNEEGDIGKLSLKCENYQNIGAFKSRGATNAALLLNDTQKANGVVTHSSGNHAQAVAFAAKRLSIPAYIVMPNNSPSNKVDGVRRHGGEVHFCEANEAARISCCADIQRRTGATLIHPYDDHRVIAGQGTIGLELIEQLPNIKRVVVPIGGGGLISGVAIALKEFNPNIEVIGVEPEGANDTAISLESRIRTPLPGGGRSIAEGLLSTVGHLNFSFIQRFVDRVITVTDREIAKATLSLFTRNKLVAEPSGAAAFAAILSGKLEGQLEDCVAIVSGGNIDPLRLHELSTFAENGEIKQGR
jgi:threonine dehydratase